VGSPAVAASGEAVAVADDARAPGRRRPEPAGPRTLRAWRRIGLVLGAPGAVLMVTGVVSGVVGKSTDAVPLAGAGSLCALGAVVFIQRVWSEPLHPRTRLTVVGERLATAFWGLWGLGVLLNALRVVAGVDVPALLDATVALLAAAAFLGVLLVASRVPAVHRG
jgi:hypothetical protein